MSDVLTVMRARLTLAVGAYSDSRESELEDLKFAAGSPDNQWQWPTDVLGQRTAIQGQTIGARPCLTINKLPQHIKQITNDMRQNRPSGKVIPVDDKADKDVAEVLNGMVRHIEYASDADVAYDTAFENQVTYGEGYIRLLTDYCDDDSFDQDIKIGRIRNSFSVYMDPTHQDPCGADAQWCFITEDVLIEEYERLWPNAQSISSIEDTSVGDDSISLWLNDKTVRIAEYFFIDYKKETLNLYPGGSAHFSGTPEARQWEALGVKPVKTRSVDKPIVKWVKTNGYEILEEQVWPGNWIPVVRVVGNEYEVEGRLYVSGIVRNAKDAQRMYNYWASQEAEMLALAPKAPFIGYGGQFEGYENQWKTANTQNWPYLEVNPDVTDGQGGPLPLPQRAQPPLPQAGLIQAKMGASDDIKSTTGQYDASLGAEANEKSGKAIMARERQTDTGTYHYIDNGARAVRHVTRQIVDLVPKIYDTRRIARIIGLDGETDYAKLDPEQDVAVREIKDQATGAVIEKIYNPSVGKYDVCVTTGPSYMTKRQESLEAMAQLLQGNPELWAVAGDLFIQNMDWPGADEIAKRWKKTIKPELLADGEETPELAAAKQQMEEMNQQMQEMHDMLINAHKSIESQELKNKEFETDIKAYDAETRRLSALTVQMGPNEVQALIYKTLQEAMSAPPLEQEEPQEFEQNEQYAQMMGNEQIPTDEYQLLEQQQPNNMMEQQ